MPKNGFTIVELLIVVVIIGVLSTLGLTTYSSVQQKARDTKRRADIDAIAKVMESKYDIKHATYTLTDLAAGFVNNQLPVPPQDNDYVVSSDGKAFVACSKLDNAPATLTHQQCVDSISTGANKQYCYCKTSTSGSVQNLVTAALAPTTAVVVDSGGVNPIPASTCAAVSNLSTTVPLQCHTTNSKFSRKTIVIDCPADRSVLNQCNPRSCPTGGCTFSYTCFSDYWQYFIDKTTKQSVQVLNYYYGNTNWKCGGGYGINVLWSGR